MPRIGSDEFILSACLSNEVQTTNRLDWVTEQLTYALVLEEISPDLREKLRGVLRSVADMARDSRAMQKRIQVQLDDQKASQP